MQSVVLFTPHCRESHPKQLKSAENWEKAIYTEAEFNFIRGEWTPKDKAANEAKIQEIRDLN